MAPQLQSPTSIQRPGIGSVGWMLDDSAINREREIIRSRFLPIIERRKMRIDLDAAPVALPSFRVRHNEAEIKRRWYKSPQAWDHHQRRVDELIKSFKEGTPIPPVMVRVLGPDRYRIWDGNHRLIASKRLGIPTIWAFLVKPTKIEQMPERRSVRYRGVLYEQVT